MAQAFAKWFYESKEWRKCRNSFFRYKHGLCERCGGAGLIVHHKVRITQQNVHDANVTLNWDNLELLCQDCHNKEHMSKCNTNNEVMFDEDGNLIKK